MQLININVKTTRAVQLYWGEQVVSSAVVVISFLRSLSCSFLVSTAWQAEKKMHKTVC